MAAPNVARCEESGGADEKHRKRRNQKKEERLRQSLMLLSAALLTLFYTWRSLLSVPESDYAVGLRSMSRVARNGLRADIGDNGRRGNHQHLNGQQKHKHSNGIFGNWFSNGNFDELDEELLELDQKIIENKNSGFRWVRTDLLPELNQEEEHPLLDISATDRRNWARNPDRFFTAKRLSRNTVMEWERDREEKDIHSDKGHTIDFTKHSYQYPDQLYQLPPLGEYPKLTSMRDIMEAWPQDDIDHPPTPFKETLMHFDFTDPHDLEAARLFRDAKLPFKLTNVPEVVAAGEKWTDNYLAQNFDGGSGINPFPRAKGSCQESPDNYFAFFSPGSWPVEHLGIPPTRNSDWTFAKWAQHARYADVTGLHPHQPHFYFQAGVDKEERYMDKSQWTFISRDLPSFSSRTETFFVFEPESQKGIQCRFGERGVTAATHFDSGRNCVGMITGAKRYILSPPKQCAKLGIVTGRGHPIFRHSMLNFGHLNDVENPEMPEEERQWLERSGDALAIETILKAGEVLYIPSHWFHYIISLQKSAQCNVRSGIDAEGDSYFGGHLDVVQRCEVRSERER